MIGDAIFLGYCTAVLAMTVWAWWSGRRAGARGFEVKGKG